MVTGETVAWVRPSDPIRGLEHRGVETRCIEPSAIIHTYVLAGDERLARRGNTK
jgi:hypothetical protein